MAFGILAAIAFAPLLILILHSENSHHLNYKYLLWKNGWGEFNPDYLRFLNVDIDHRQSLIGKSLTEIEELFPSLHDTTQPIADFQTDHLHISPHSDYRQIGGSDWVIEFEHDRVKTFHCWKAN